MTVGEFRAFLEGMDVQGSPSPLQWKRILEKVKLMGDPVPSWPQPVGPQIDPTQPIKDWPDLSPMFTTCSAQE